jgi:UDP-hydrolysing UDP-N-acetyl-D-glucosamine 2-epimerase
MKQNIAVLTTARSEYYQLQPVLASLREVQAFNLQLFVSGSHLSSKFGQSERDIDLDGIDEWERLPILVDDDSGLGAALTSGLAVQAIAGALSRRETDLLLLAGDRYETLAAALAATCVGVPIAHLHGGELTEGAIDDACRHAITKLSDLHFVSTGVYRARVMQLGEPADRVFEIGAPLLDQVLRVKLADEGKIAECLGVAVRHPLALIAYHPPTREDCSAGEVCRYILESASQRCETVIMTGPNHDPGYDEVQRVMAEFSQARNECVYFANLGSPMFLSLMACADIMCGNSSSGIHEAASFELPVVNIGDRQAGRLCPRNVLSCQAEKADIDRNIELGLSDGFARSIQGLKNPFGNGQASKMLADELKNFAPFKEVLRRKAFRDGVEVKEAVELWGNQQN